MSPSCEGNSEGLGRVFFSPQAGLFGKPRHVSVAFSERNRNGQATRQEIPHISLLDEPKSRLGPRGLEPITLERAQGLLRRRGGTPTISIQRLEQPLRPVGNSCKSSPEQGKEPLRCEGL